MGRKEVVLVVCGGGGGKRWDHEPFESNKPR